MLAESLRRGGEPARSRSELDTALGLAPNDAETLALAAGLVAAGDQPERGAAHADRAAWLSPAVSSSALPSMAFAYYAAGRYRAALDLLERLAPENHTLVLWAIHPAALAQIGRGAEAAEWRERGLAARPELANETVVGVPGLGGAARRRLEEGMRLAGLGACAPVAVDGIERLPECRTEQAAAR